MVSKQLLIDFKKVMLTLNEAAEALGRLARDTNRPGPLLPGTCIEFYHRPELTRGKRTKAGYYRGMIYAVTESHSTEWPNYYSYAVACPKAGRVLYCYDHSDFRITVIGTPLVEPNQKHAIR